MGQQQGQGEEEGLCGHVLATVKGCPSGRFGSENIPTVESARLDPPLARLLEGKKAVPGKSLRDRTGGMVCVTRKERFFLKGDRVDLEREDAIRYFFGCSERDLEISW